MTGEPGAGRGRRSGSGAPRLGTLQSAEVGLVLGTAGAGFFFDQIFQRQVESLDRAESPRSPAFPRRGELDPGSESRQEIDPGRRNAELYDQAGSGQISGGKAERATLRSLGISWIPFALREERRHSSTAATRSSGVIPSYQKRKSASSASSSHTTVPVQTLPWRSVAFPRISIVLDRSTGRVGARTEAMVSRQAAGEHW